MWDGTKRRTILEKNIFVDFFFWTAVYNAGMLDKVFLLLGMSLFVGTGAWADETGLSPSHALILGVTQGVTEFLPVSSTGHMLLINECYFKTDRWTTQRAQRALDDYIVCIQIGTILTLLFVYRREIRRILRGFLGRDALGFRLGVNVGVAFVPAGVCGFLFGDWFRRYGYGKWGVAGGLIAGALLVLITNRRRMLPSKNEPHRNVFAIPMRVAIGVGICQLLALWPGMSRSLTTILGGVWLGLSLAQSVHFSFLLGLCTSVVATAYTLIKHGPEMFQHLSISSMTIGVVSAAILGFVTVWGFFRFLKNHTLIVFAYYRLILAVVVGCSTI
jgi:undecaprenyl-diphosphatase